MPCKRGQRRTKEEKEKRKCEAPRGRKGGLGEVTFQLRAEEQDDGPRAPEEDRRGGPRSHGGESGL